MQGWIICSFSPRQATGTTAFECRLPALKKVFTLYNQPQAEAVLGEGLPHVLKDGNRHRQLSLHGSHVLPSRYFLGERLPVLHRR
jgi:hypothetical protein